MRRIFKNNKRSLRILSILISAIVILGVSLFLTMCGSGPQRNTRVIVINESTEWEVVASYIDDYIQSQYVATDDGEAGFLYTAALYKSRVDTNSNGTLCGVGDDMANRPVLVDNLISTATLIPGTSIRNQWNSTSTTLGGLSATIVTALRDKVIAHREAGFSDDIVVY